MTDPKQIPLVSPPRRRSWRQVIWLRPLVSSPQSAMVATRRGRLVSVLPANGVRVFSDYVTLPYTFREVDMRQRLLVVEQQLEACDAGYEFRVALRLTYQVARPERVALELHDALAELEQAVAQTMRQIARAFGVEQAKALEQHLEEVAMGGDALLHRVGALGFALRRADATVTLDERAQAHAEELRDHMRERPLHAQFSIDSLDPDRSFAVQVGGFYRMTSRTPSGGSALGMESAIQQAIARTLQRVGITFSPQDYQAAAKAMADTLRQDALLQAELLVIHTQLLRPTVQIQPDRSMVQAPPQSNLPNARPEPPARGPSPGLIRPEHADGAAPPWSALAAVFSYAPPSPAAAAGAGPPSEAGHSPGRDPRPAQAKPPLKDGAPGAGLPPTRAADAALLGGQPPTPEMSDVPADAEVDGQQIERFLALLHDHRGPAWFKMCSLELIEAPDRLAAIIAEVTAEPDLLAASADARLQQALARALHASPSIGVMAIPARPLAAPPEPPAAEPDEEQDDLPDWLRSYQKRDGDGGAR